MDNIFFAVPNAFIENKYNIENSSSVVLPNSFFAKICNDDDYKFPYYFEIEHINDSINKKKICVSVFEFTADDQTVVIPFWLFENLGINPYEPVILTYKQINPGKYLKIQPHQMKFIEQNDPREILEKKLSNFSCLTSGTTISFIHDDNLYKFNILEIKDESENQSEKCNYISLLNIDLNIDFERPLDKPKTPVKKAFENNVVFGNKNDNNCDKEKPKFTPFSGKGVKLGKS